MSDAPAVPDPATLDPEDAKILTLARSARARIGASAGAAVRDVDGRTYAAADVALPSLRLTALQLAVASAAASGATGLEAAAVVTSDGADGVEVGVVSDLGGPGIPVYVAGPDGTPVAVLRS